MDGEHGNWSHGEYKLQSSADGEPPGYLLNGERLQKAAISRDYGCPCK